MILEQEITAKRKRGLRKYLFCLLSIACSALFLLVNLQCTDRYNQFATGPSVQLYFSADTVRLDTLFSRLSSSTFGVMVYNRNPLAVKLQEIRLKGSPESGFRINVDGRSGSHFQNITLPGKDSIFIFLEATFPEGASNLLELQEDDIIFKLEQKEQKIHLEAYRQNIYQYSELLIQKDTTLTAERPIYIVDSLVVAEGATLTMESGTHILMGDKAHISVYGSLRALGTAEQRIMFEGLRRDNLIPKVNYRLIPGQWEYLLFATTSSNNLLHYTTLRNGRGGVKLYATPHQEGSSLSMKGTIITNMKGNALYAHYGTIEMENCECSNTLLSTLDFNGGKYVLNHCSIINLYPWDNRQGGALHYNVEDNASSSSLEISNTVVDGSYSVQRLAGKTPSGGELQFGDNLLRFIQIRNSYLRTPIDLWNIFHNCIEATLPLDKVYHNTGRDRKKNTYNFIYDYRPLPEAPFVEKAVGALATDLLGRSRASAPTIGAYEPAEAPKEE
ncbi:MAG: hypothetical protein Q4A57_01160 [Porphyromonas circumdentaria]|nr:hypothetical protein [Porphyromonas circumdentaria]